MTFDEAIGYSIQRFDAASAELRAMIVDQAVLNHECGSIKDAMIEWRDSIDEIGRLKVAWSVACNRKKKFGGEARC